MENIKIKIDGREIGINHETYVLLFDNSLVYGENDYIESLDKNRISFSKFVRLARKADIPYALFFAPLAFVEKCVDEKMKKLLSGVSKETFSMNSRGNVQIRDIELIVKDLMRKQELLKYLDSNIKDNTIYNSLYGSRDSLEIQADKIRNLIGIDLEVIMKFKKKTVFKYLVDLLESKNVFISQSSKSFMPQIIKSDILFSGFCIKDKKIPFIFLNNKDELISFEPEGRKILTLILLAVCLAKGKFKPVSYAERTRSLINTDEFIIAEEILMPSNEMIIKTVGNLEDIKDLSDIFCVTPSAIIMRLLRLLVIDQQAANDYLDELRIEFENRQKPDGPRQPKPENGFKKYNGAGYSKALIKHLENGQLGHKDAVRVLFQNKKSVDFLYRDYSGVL